MHTLLALLCTAAGALLADEPARAPSAAGNPSATAAAIDRKVEATNGAQPADAAKSRKTRVLLITSTDSTRSAEELARLNRPGGDFEQMRSRGWKIGAGPENHLQVVDRESVPEVVKMLKPSVYPAVACLEGDEIVRSFREGCTTPLDMWTFGWMHKGIDERPPGAVMEKARVETTGHFPLRGNHWTIDGDSNPPKAVVISHLHGGFHGPQLSSSWSIEQWSYEELRSMHDYLHERYGGGVTSSSRSSSGSRSSSQFSASRKTTGR